VSLRTTLTVPVELARRIDAVQDDEHPALRGQVSASRSHRVELLLDYALRGVHKPRRKGDAGGRQT
jgi:hypothetical protein